MTEAVSQKRLSERLWVESLLPRLSASLTLPAAAVNFRVASGRRLPYVHEIGRYKDDEPVASSTSRYETDLLVYDEHEDGTWTPRVVIECKKDAVTTHDALTYSAKAATHKHVHPYLRYGILIGAWGDYSLPPRLVKHGAHFDFMATWRREDPSDKEWFIFVEVLRSEIMASRYLQLLLTDRKFKKKEMFSLLHRPLVIK